MDLPKGEPDFCDETCVASSYDGNQVIDIKVEEGTYVKEEEDAQSVFSPTIKTEHEVRCMTLSPVYLRGVKKQMQHQLFMHVLSHNNFYFLLNSGTNLTVRVV
jgi:hypothetical protein